MSSKRLQHSSLVLVTFLVLTLSILALTPTYVKAQTPAEGQTFVVGRYLSIPVPYNATITNVFLSDIKNDGSYALLWVSKAGLIRAYTAYEGNSLWEQELHGKTITYSFLADVDNDNLPELVLGTSDGYIIELDPASFGTPVFVRYLKQPNIPVLKIIPSNLDMDPQDEFIVVQKNGLIVFVDNNGVILRTIRSYAASVDVVTADINNDSIDEVFYATSSGTISLMFANGTQIFTESIIGENFTSVVASDIDNDGIPEFIVGGNKALYVYKSDGRQLNTRTFPNPISRLSLVDIDKNGILELLLLSGQDLYILSSHTLSFIQIATISPQYSIIDIIPINFDNDKALELLITTYQGTLLFYDNDLSLLKTYTVLAGSPIYSCAVADLDGDGLDEISVAGKFRDAIILGIDTDGDGLLNIEENLITKTNPNLIDTDGDQMSDYDEYVNGRNPLVYDSDYDGIPDGLDFINGINDVIFYAALLVFFVGVPSYKYMKLRKEEEI